MTKPRLLRVPIEIHTYEELLGVMRQYEGVTHGMFIGYKGEQDRLVFLVMNMSTAEANYLIDQTKHILMGPAPEYIVP